MSNDDNSFSIQELFEIGVEVEPIEGNGSTRSELADTSDFCWLAEIIDGADATTERDDSETESNGGVSFCNTDASLNVTRPDQINVNNDDEHGELSKSKKRNRIPQVGTWYENQQKRLRMEGEEYIGFKKNIGGSKIKAVKPARSLGPRCDSTHCEKLKARFCNRISDEVRQDIFTTFWKNMDWNQKHVYITSLVDKVSTKTSSTNSRRQCSYNYYLKCYEEKKQVCKQMFLATLGVKETQFLLWMKKPITSQFRNVSEIVEKSIKRKSVTEGTNFLNSFFDALPKMPSHYCKNDSTKLYLEPIFQTKTELYNVYKQKCDEVEQMYLSHCTFDKLFATKNLSLFRPKKDKCDICCGYELNTIPEDIYQAHCSIKDLPINSKKADKVDAIAGKCHVILMGVESVKVSPKIYASSSYYKSKLIVHNFTIYNLEDKVAKCYWWDESEGDMRASTFSTCVINFISRWNDGKPIVIYSDGCTHQNNVVMSNSLLHFSMQKNVVIFQKFFEKGHSEKECASIHSSIERQLKNKDVPKEYLEKCLSARKNPFPYEAEYIDHSYFFNYDHNKIYPSIRPGNSVGDPTVTQLRCIKYSPSGIIEYKLNYNDNWAALPRSPRLLEVNTNNFPKLFNARLPISKKKWQDLQDLKSVLPLQHHLFYDTIPYSQ